MTTQQPQQQQEEVVEEHGTPKANEPHNLNNKKKKKKKKRKSVTMAAQLAAAADNGKSRLARRVVLSLTKPSYCLGLGSKTLRSENRARLSYLLGKLTRQHNWTEASGVLSVLLKGTCKDKSLANNRFKYSALMEVIEILGADSFDETRIRNIYDVWKRKTTTMKGRPVEDRYVVHLAHIVFCLTQGSTEEAYQLAFWLMQETEFGRDPDSNMIVGLACYQKWYSTIPKEMLLTESYQVYSPGQTNKLLAYSEGWERINSNQAGTGFQCDSDSSIKNNKGLPIHSDSGLQTESSVGDEIQIENLPQNFRPQGFYANSDENTGNEASISNHGDQLHFASTFSALDGLDPVLLPVRLPRPTENYEDTFYLHVEMLNEHYKEAVMYLRHALCSTPTVLAALLPFIQLLLVGGQVDEALNELNKFCCNSNSTLPTRLRASLLEHFGHNNMNISTYFEDILKKDPTCGDSLAKLVTMHRNGEYGCESLLEMIASHLDASYADYNIWREFASCFLKLSQHEEDQMSVCLNGRGVGLGQYSVSFNKIPRIFTECKSQKIWRLRCRWWMTRHFSLTTLALDIAADDLQLLTYKAACASHMFGPQFSYVVDAYTCLEKKNEIDLFLILKLNITKSVGLYSSFEQNNR
ncbi:TAF RNA polymerase I subunit A [Parasponia andersonii]|uniref:TAF RNA polymerase I subunit A n=1 Tax=Parasponia andersonii TaxID=3476 RepID=A0A2P5BVH2_PARAD|nr:TAF RNA polymerase I subunit A [Parasponia andersonii]